MTGSQSPHSVWVLASPPESFLSALKSAQISGPRAEMARGLETFLTAFAVGFVVCGPGTADPLLRDFSVCAGRFSALVAHQWLVDGPASEGTARQRDAMLALVEAVTSPDAAPAVM
jgi:hypothetical protein